jgi:hypothetical protein
MTTATRDVTRNLVHLVLVAFGFGAAIALTAYLISLPFALVHWVTRLLGGV